MDRRALALAPGGFARKELVKQGSTKSLAEMSGAELVPMLTNDLKAVSGILQMYYS